MLRGNCPFHEDSSGSFMVYPAKGIFKCFGCGQEGGADEFLKAIGKEPSLTNSQQVA